ncbi:hypothetical protein [Streptomyces profundus]|uniref:hypothetical protein n=1 Tax=Streptomyces profundus TaxID=2867410 RepID=UPI001D169E0A|nr:hypothetical protein [Streptomyces sp. MA3_2.13]UED84594.1 hypothetical protein K4G22_10580 [Streptomyces sp. MA3_2.13]
MARHSSGSSSGVFVTALTAAALAVVGFFAYQASAADNWPPSTPAAPPAEETEGGSDNADGGADGGVVDEQPALPAESGEGRRVVYALEQRRIWLVDESEDGTGEAVTRTYEVFPSSQSPDPGSYAITSRWEQGTGSDGVAIEHSVIFHTADDGTVFGFSAAVDGSTPNPEASQRTGAVRQTRADGEVMWEFATEGSVVVVVP